MTESATTLERIAATAIAFSLLPPLGQPLEGGTFCGIVTAADGTHNAVILLSDKPDGCKSYADAMAWAESVGGTLPSRSVSAMLFANCKSLFDEDWHWTNEAEGASYAWYCFFDNGDQYCLDQSNKLRARAVRLIRVSA